MRTTGSHHLKFEFGDGVAYASNDATATNVTTSNDDGAYTTGESIFISIGLSEPVNLELSATILPDSTYNFDSIITATVDESIYALVVNSYADTIRIFNITLPFAPSLVYSMDGIGSGPLTGARSLANVAIGDATYVLVAGHDRMDILNMTNPASTYVVASTVHGEQDSQGTEYTALEGDNSVAVRVIDGRTYALVTGFTSDGVQIIDITDPFNPLATASAVDGGV